MLLRTVYLLLITPLMLYALSVFYLLWVYVRVGSKRPPVGPHLCEAELPAVLVQIPLYNEQHVAARVIEAVAALDYPPQKLQIQVLDDSTDNTTLIVERISRRLSVQGVNIEVVRRADRTGYKGGALAHGLGLSDAPFVAVFDADFVPPSDFLRRAIPIFFEDAQIGVVQGRWDHLNREDNLLTRCQALMLDGHFAIEQHTRSSGGLIFSFNGTGGIWRRACIDDAGGWEYDTLTEDADLSLRAQMRGWRFVFVRDLVCPGEIPPLMSGFKSQQARWAKGTTQTLIKHGWRLLDAPLPLRRKLMAFLGMCAYPIQPFGLGLLLIMPWVMVSGALNGLPLAPLGIAGLAVPLLYILGQKALHPDWLGRSMWFPALFVLSSGLAWSNSWAVWEALRGRSTAFVRTPKFKRDGSHDKAWRASVYNQQGDGRAVGEFGLGLYSTIGAILAVHYNPSLIPYFVTYAVGFFIVAGWGIADGLTGLFPSTTVKRNRLP